MPRERSGGALGLRQAGGPIEAGQGEPGLRLWGLHLHGFLVIGSENHEAAPPLVLLLFVWFESLLRLSALVVMAWYFAEKIE